MLCNPRQRCCAHRGGTYSVECAVAATDSASLPAFCGSQFLRFIILLSNMIPISLYVSLEVVKVFQCTLLLNSDREMYHE
jgi:magnesium-transporting ATPase (P-type)